MASNVDSDWEDITPDSDSDWEDVSPQSSDSQPGIIQQTMRNTGMDLSPAGLLGMGMEKVQEGARNLGKRFSEVLPKTGIKPLFARESIPVSQPVANAMGKIVEYAPDIATFAATPLEASKTAVDAAVGPQMRSMGFQKSFFKTPFARGQAQKAARTALEEGVTDTFGSPSRMFQKASDLANRSSEAIKSTIKEVPVSVKNAFDNLESLRNQITQGAGKEGGFSGVHKAIDSVQNDISDLTAMSGGPSNKLFAGNLNKIKSRLGNSLNYLADLTSQGDNKAIVTNLANTIRDAVKDVVPAEEFIQYLKNQKLFSAAELMKKGLNNEIAGQMGNSAVSIPSVGMGAARFAAGDIPGTLAAVGVTEGLKRRGAGIAANAIQKIGSNVPLASGAVPSTSRILKKRSLDKSTAAKYLDQAGGDPEKALELAEQDGY